MKTLKNFWVTVLVLALMNMLVLTLFFANSSNHLTKKIQVLVADSTEKAKTIAKLETELRMCQIDRLSNDTFVPTMNALEPIVNVKNGWSGNLPCKEDLIWTPLLTLNTTGGYDYIMQEPPKIVPYRNVTR